MRNVVWLVLLFAVAVVAALTLGDNAGMASFYWGGWRIDLSLNFFILAALATGFALMTAVQASRGVTVNRMLHINESAGDLLNKLEAVRLVCQETGCAQRYLTHDAMNAIGQVAARIDNARGTTEHRARFTEYLHHVQDHDLTLGVTHSTVRNRFQLQAFNYVGTGNVQGTLVAPADPSLTDQNTQRDERSLEWSVQDAIRWNDQFTTWLGMRQTRLNRDSVRTNGSRPTSYSDSLVTPWLAASWQWAPARLAYASYGEGVERIFPVYSPLVEAVEIVRRGKVRRAKLYYLRSRSGKSARIKEKLA